MLVPVPLVYTLIALMLISVTSSVVCVIALLKRVKQEEDIDTRLKEFDNAFEEGVTEINKVATLISDEINDKYKSILFLYNLMEDKQIEPEIKIKTETVYESDSKLSVYDKARELFLIGHNVKEIAKALGIGQGEVKLIVDLYNKKK